MTIRYVVHERDISPIINDPEAGRQRRKCHVFATAASDGVALSR